MYMIKCHESNTQEINMQNISCHIHYHNKVQPNDKEVMVNISHTLRYTHIYTSTFNPQICIVLLFGSDTDLDRGPGLES